MASAFDKLKKTAGKTKPKSKTTAEINNPELNDACDKLVRSSQEYKDATAAYQNDQSPILDFMREIHGQSIEEGDPTKSYKLNEKIVCTFTDRFSSPSEQDMQELSANLPDEVLKKLFREKATIKVKESVAMNDTKLNELIALLGDNVEKYFDVNVSLVAVDDLDRVVATEGCYEQAKDVIERIRYKPTIKIAG